MDQPSNYVRIRTYADRYDVAPKTVRKWADQGLVQILKIGRLWRVLDRPPARAAHAERTRHACSG